MILQQRRRTRRKREEKIGGKKSCFNLVSICKMSPLTKYFDARSTPVVAGAYLLCNP
jgi:hypothetical protein